jgi:HAE1 family hydrophobic/amphiphilic exporter-1
MQRRDRPVVAICGDGITTVAAQADFVVDAPLQPGEEIVAGGLLSLPVILLFLRDWRVSMASAWWCRYPCWWRWSPCAMNVSINVSLGGLALGTGLLVDTAIVVAESVGRRREEGMPLLQAAIEGTDEVSAPLFAGTLTTVLVFGPIIFVRGLAAALFRDLSLSVVTTVAASLLLSLTLMPVMIIGRRRSARALEGAPPALAAAATKTPATGVGGMLDRWGATLTAWYEHGMLWSLRNVKTVFALALAAVAVTGYLIWTLPKEILPRVDEGVLVAQLQLPEGTSIEATAAQVGRVEAAGTSLGASGIYSRVGKATDEEILGGADPGSSATAQLLVPAPASADAADFAQMAARGLPDLAGGALAIDLAAVNCPDRAKAGCAPSCRPSIGESQRCRWCAAHARPAVPQRCA